MTGSYASKESLVVHFLKLWEASRTRAVASGIPAGLLARSTSGVTGLCSEGRRSHRIVEHNDLICWEIGAALESGGWEQTQIPYTGVLCTE